MGKAVIKGKARINIASESRSSPTIWEERYAAEKAEKQKELLLKLSEVFPSLSLKSWCEVWSAGAIVRGGLRAPRKKSSFFSPCSSSARGVRPAPEAARGGEAG